MSAPQAFGSTTIPCPSCGAPAAGRFCTQCGAVVREANCTACGVALTPGSKFCHECGTSVALQVARQRVAVRLDANQRKTAAVRSNNLPWILGGLAFITLIVIYAAQRAAQTPPQSMPPAPSGAAAVDISSMTPQERAARLFDRIMRLSEEGKRDSVELFASMAVTVYESLGPLDLDARYDLGRIAQVSGQLDLARAQADSILAQSPDHLLGLILAAAVADARGNQAERATFERRLLAAETSQLARGLEEYTRHRSDIDGALTAARRRP
jgi:double zinc ribbon protein